MPTDSDVLEGDESYFEEETSRIFDASLLQEPLKSLPTRQPLVFAPSDSVTDAMRSMQAERRGCVLVTADGTRESRLLGIFSERDVLLRIVGRGRNPANLALSEVMTTDPESLPREGCSGD